MTLNTSLCADESMGEKIIWNFGIKSCYKMADFLFVPAKKSAVEGLGLLGAGAAVELLGTRFHIAGW